MTKITTNASSCLWLAALCALGTASCTLESGSEGDTAATASELGESTCATASPTASMPGGFNYTSPQTYTTSGCADAVVVDAYPISDTDPPVVRYAASSPSGEIACENLWLQATLYRDIDPEIGIFAPVRTLTASGDWSCRFRSCVCQRPTVTFGSLNAGEAYRIAASGRTNPAGATRSITIKN